MVCRDVSRSVRGHAHVLKQGGCGKQDGTKPLSRAPEVPTYFNVPHLMPAMRVWLFQMTEWVGVGVCSRSVSFVTFLSTSDENIQRSF